MQEAGFCAVILAYTACALEAWRVSTVSDEIKAIRIVAAPGLIAALAFFGGLYLPLLRAYLTKVLWRSFEAGYGQSPISVLTGFGAVLGLGLFVAWHVHSAAATGGLPGADFSAYAAALGLSGAQVGLVRRMEADPVNRRRIEAP
jgi:hypothetical protein